MKNESSVRRSSSPTPHVCMIVHSPYPVGEPRGEREAHAMIEAGYAVSMICLRAADEVPTETANGVQILRLPIQHARDAGTLRFLGEYLRFTFRSALAVLRIHRRQPLDVVYVHAPPDFLVAAALIPKLLGSRVVLDIHDLSPDMFEARFGRRFSARLATRMLRSVERGACALADRVVTVHRPYRDELARDGVPPRKITVVMNAPDPDVIDRARNAAGARATSNSFVVGYHGTVNHWYGVDLLVEAIARLEEHIPDMSGLVIGEGDALGTVEHLARRLGVDDRIEFSRAYVSNADALRRIALASCGVIPNRHSRLNRFALSSKLLEYVALGVPVVVARLETLAAHFGPEEVTFFDPDDAESLALAMAWVAQNPADAREKAERARRRAEAYSWPESRARLLKAVDDVTR
jgi:glycosyltransferase involved in cell wall biosynthesis